MRTAEQRPKSVTSSDAAPNPEAPQEDRFRKQDWPFYWITQVSARYMQVMEVRLKRIGLDVPSWRVLMCLHEDDWLSVSQIADYSIIKLNTATRIIQRMESQGLVWMFIDPFSRMLISFIVLIQNIPGRIFGGVDKDYYFSLNARCIA